MKPNEKILSVLLILVIIILIFEIIEFVAVTGINLAPGRVPDRPEFRCPLPPNPTQEDRERCMSCCDENYDWLSDEWQRCMDWCQGVSQT